MDALVEGVVILMAFLTATIIFVLVAYALLIVMGFEDE